MRSALVLVVAVVSFGGAARAQRDGGDDAPPAFRPFVFSTDADTVGRGHAAVETGAGYNGLPQAGTARADDARRFDTWLLGAVGLTDRLELDGSVTFANQPGQDFGFGEGRAELRARVLDVRGRLPISVALGAGYVADARFESAAEALVAVTAALGPVDLVLNLRALHYFAAGRDPIDVFVTAGAEVRATRWLRAGVEYIGEELEGATGQDVDSEGGGRHYVGPTAAVLVGRVRLNATAGAVLTPAGLGALGRGSIAYLF